MSTSASGEYSGRMDEDAEVVFQAVHSIWEEWSQRFRSFRCEPAWYIKRGEPPSEVMQVAFQSELETRLRAARPSADWSVELEMYLVSNSRRPPPRPYSAFGPYDIEVRAGGRRIALLELSCGDTDVCHALHNGELKLLGNCDGVGISTEKPFAEVVGLTPGAVDAAQRCLRSVPLRGLFFVSQKPYRALEREEKSQWHPTPTVDQFRSALLPHRTMTTLAEVFPELAKAGLHCWFYSAGAEETREPPEYFPAQA